MSNAAKPRNRGNLIKPSLAAVPVEAAFDEVLRLIEASRGRAFAAVNNELVELYWEIGEYISRRVAAEEWGKRELERQLSGALFERTILNPPILAPALRELHPAAATIFKDSYLLEFLQLPVAHSEDDLHHGLVEQLKKFLIELGRGFCFVGSEYPLQVGGRDFSIDLVLFNRALNCLVAIELKIDEFQPEHLGKLEFYLEALDRDVRKPHENPSIGVLLCATKDHEVVEYAMSRALSPALVAEYRTRLPDKNLLQAKLHEFYALAEPPPPHAPTRLAPPDLSARPRPHCRNLLPLEAAGMVPNFQTSCPPNFTSRLQNCGWPRILPAPDFTWT